MRRPRNFFVRLGGRCVAPGQKFFGNHQFSLPWCGAPYQRSMKFLTQKTKWANISPPSKRNLNGEMAFPWRTNDDPTLNAGSVVYD